uniref:Uncharacterized protein n=1 Tax=viral metagenome TaxID=1070528 RepID=A0A6C0JNV1_9ZZZZ
MLKFLMLLAIAAVNSTKFARPTSMPTSVPTYTQVRTHNERGKLGLSK